MLIKGQDFLEIKKYVARDKMVYGLTREQSKKTKAKSFIDYIRDNKLLNERINKFKYEDTNLFKLMSKNINIPEGSILYKMVELTDLHKNTFNIWLPSHIRSLAIELNLYTSDIINHSIPEEEEILSRYKLLENLNYYTDNAVTEKVIAMIDFCQTNGFDLSSN
jgi:hypothetical protein